MISGVWTLTETMSGSFDIASLICENSTAINLKYTPESLVFCDHVTSLLSSQQTNRVRLLSTDLTALYEFFVHVAYGRGSLLLRRRRCDTLCTSGFVDDIIFSIMSLIAVYEFYYEGPILFEMH